MSQLAKMVRDKHPGAYDDMDDAALEAAIVAKYPGQYDDLLDDAPTASSRIEPPAVPQGSTGGRVVSGAWNALKGMGQVAAKASGVPGLFREGPLGAIKDQFEVGKALFYDAPRDQFEKARTAPSGAETALRAAAGAVPVVGPAVAYGVDEIAAGRAPELVGETLAGLAVPGGIKAAQGAKSALVARAVRKSASALKAADMDLMTAFPSKSYAPKDLAAARPYLNEQHKATPITSAQGYLEAADAAIGGIESRIGTVLESFPEAKLNPWAKVRASVQEAFKDNPRAKAMETAAKELDDLPLNSDLSLGELDRLRLQMNAENKAILKRNNYDQATARRVDPGFAAREAAARAIRDTLYDYLETRGVEGVRQLRMDEGALIKVRNAAEKNAHAGARGVNTGQEQSLARRALATLAQRGSTAVGAAGGGAPGAILGAEVGEVLGGAIRGSRSTRDALVARAFSAADDRLPTYPTVPARRPVAGELPPAPIELGAVPDTSYARGVPTEPARRIVRGELPPARVVREAGAPDTSGPIPATLPENYVREIADRGGVPQSSAKAAPEERQFMARWLADDLREVEYQSSSRMRGIADQDARSDAKYGERVMTYSPRSAGTPTLDMFHSLGVKGTRAEIADRLDRYVRSGKGSPKIEALADAMREAWDGTAFDFDLLSDETVQRLGVRRRDLRSPVTMPAPDDMPSVYARFFGDSK